MYSDYYLWLESLVNDGNHHKLIRYLHDKDYYWQFSLDDNRAAGGINLRRKYAYENGIELYDIGVYPCTVLEMLIALADRMVEILTMDIYDWFWDLLNNLKLDQFDDAHFDKDKVDHILTVWLSRQFDSKGNGSLFPLSNYPGDCRNLDVWSQMNAWIEENYPHSDDWLLT